MIINLPKIGPVKFRDDLSPQELDAQVAKLSKKYGFAVPKPDIGMGQIAKRGFARSMGELGIATTDTIPAIVGSSLGFNDYAKRQMGEAEAARAQLEAEYPTRFKSYQDVNGLGEGAEFVAETLGELGPTALGAMVPGVGAGAVAGRLAGQAALKQATQKGVNAAAAGHMAGLAGQKAAKRAMYGGVFFGSAAQNVPEVFESIYRETDKFEPGLAALAGGLSSMLDSIVPGQVLDQLGTFGRQKLIAEMAKQSGAAPKVWKTLAANATKSAATEGLTESVQEAIGATAEQIAGSTKDVFAPENIQRYKEAFVKGAIGGGAFGTVGGVGQAVEQRREIRDNQVAEQALAAQEQQAQDIPTDTQQSQAMQFESEQEAARAAREAELSKIFAQKTPYESREEALTQAFGQMPELEKHMSDLEGLKAQLATVEPGTPVHNAVQENIVALQELIQNKFGNGNVAEAESLKVTPEAIKRMGLRKGDKFAKFINGMDLQKPDDLAKLIRVVESPLPTDPSFEGSPLAESVYNKLLGAVPPEQVARVREGFQGNPVEQQAPTQEQVSTQAPAPVQEAQPEMNDEAVQNALASFAAQEEQAAAGNPVAEQNQMPMQPAVQSLDDLAHLDPNDPNDVAEVLRFADTVKDKQVQKQLNQWTDKNVYPEVMSEALAMTSEPDAPVRPKVEAAPKPKQPAKPAPQPVRKQEPVKPADPVENLLTQSAYKHNTPEKAAHTYFDTYDRDLALKSVANDLVYQPTSYRGEAGFEGQGGRHAKAAERWIRKNLPEAEVKAFDKHLKDYQKEKETAAATDTVVDNTLPKAEPKKKESKPQSKLDEILKKAAFGYDATKKGQNFHADGETAKLHTKAHPNIHRHLEAGSITEALKNLAASPSSPMVKQIATKLHPHLNKTKVNYGAKESSFDPETNTIHLRKEATEYEILHEATHAAVSHIIANKAHPVTQQLSRLYDQAKDSFDPLYGTTNLQEFVAEAWSNNDFRNQLDSMRDLSSGAARPNNMSLWDKIVDMLRRLFGLPPRKNASALDQVDALLNEIASPAPDKRTGDTLFAQSINDPKIVQRVHEHVDNLIKKAPLMNEERATTFWGNLEKLTTSGKALVYRALNLSALGQVSKNAFGNMGVEFSDTVNAMSGYQENLQERGQPLHQRLQKFARDARYQEWSTLVHDSTKADVNPEAPQSKYKDDKEKLAAWFDLKARFNRMTPDMKKLYKDLFAAYKTLNEETMKSLEGNVLASIPDKALAQSTYKKLLAELAKVQIEHYAPLFRRGVYRLDYDLNGDRVQEFYTTQAERKLARQKAEAKGAKEVDEYTTSDPVDANNVPSGTILSQMVTILKEGGASEKAVEQVATLVARAMPETSMWKRRMKREGVSGYIDDAALAFDNVTSSTFHQLSRIKYSSDLNKLLQGMAAETNKLRGPDQEHARLLLEEFKNRHQFAINPDISSVAQLASTGSFFYFLAGNVSSAVVNTLQLPLIVGPQLGGEYGFRNATQALNKAMQLYTSSGFRRKVNDLSGNVVEEKAMWSLENSVNNGKTPEYKGLLNKLKEYGFLQTSTARDAVISANQPTSAYGGTTRLHYLTNLAGTFMFHHAERMNREVTAIAAYDLEKNKLSNNKTLSRDEIEARAIDKAIRAVETMHGAGHTVTGPSLGHSDLGKVLMVFKRFAFSMYYMLFDTMRRALPIKGATGEQLEGIKAARRQLAGIYGMSFLFAGAKGLPLYWIGELAYNAFADDDEDDFDTVMRRFLGDLPYKGPVNYFTNLSIADRVGWSDLIFREGKTDKADASTLSSYIEGIFGAPYAIVNNMFRAKDLAVEGHYERAVETALPIALRNMLKGPRFAVEGVNTLRGDPVMGEVNGYNAAMQALGFAPADLSIRYMDNEYMKKKEAKLMRTRDILTRQYYLADRSGDTERADEVKGKLFEFGDKHPELGISEKFLERSVAARDRISAELHNGVHISKKFRESLIEDVEDFK